MRFSEKKAKKLRRQVLEFASVVLRRTADGSEFPACKSDDEDEWMREEMHNIADDLLAEATQP